MITSYLLITRSYISKHRITLHTQEEEGGYSRILRISNNSVTFEIHGWQIWSKREMNSCWSSDAENIVEIAFHEVVPCGVKTHVCCKRLVRHIIIWSSAWPSPILWALAYYTNMFRFLSFWKQFFWGLGTQFYTKLNLTVGVPFCSQNFVQIVSMCIYPCTTFLQNTLNKFC
jgi:hypothetical protein